MSSLRSKSRENSLHTLTLDHVSPATRLLEKRRQMFEVQEALDVQKEEFARREDAFRRREETLRKKDLELQESLIKFNKFLQENESKRNRALKRASDEQKNREQKEAEIARLKQEYRLKQEEDQAVKKGLEMHVKYRDYLTNVFEGVEEEYNEIQDLLNRFETLKHANLDLAKAHRDNEQKNESQRQLFGNFKKECQNEILNRTNDIAKKQKLYEQKTGDVLRLQNIVDSSVESSSKELLELGQVIRTVRNLHDRIETRLQNTGRSSKNSNDSHAQSSTGSPEQLDLESQRAVETLDEITAYMIDYEEIVQEWSSADRKSKRHSSTLAGESTALMSETTESLEG